MQQAASDPPFTYTKHGLFYGSLDNAQLETRCPLDNGRHAYAPNPSRRLESVGQLDQLPADMLIYVILFGHTVADSLPQREPPRDGRR